VHATHLSFMPSACTCSSCSHYTSAPCHRARARRRGYSQCRLHYEAFVSPTLLLDIRVPLLLPSRRSFHGSLFYLYYMDHGVHARSSATLLRPSDEHGQLNIFYLLDTRYSARLGGTQTKLSMASARNIYISVQYIGMPGCNCGWYHSKARQSAETNLP
jgi:hypothetical protein